MFWLPDRKQPEIDRISGWPDFAGPETGVFDKLFVSSDFIKLNSCISECIAADKIDKTLG